jgi:hypothetical protein
MHIKTRTVTRTCTLQADRHKFNRYEVEPLYQLCNIESEDLPHMLTTCVAFVDIRNELYIPIKCRVINLIGPRKWKVMFNNRQLPSLYWTAPTLLKNLETNKTLMK